MPTFVDGDEVLTQSLAIIEYLEETHPEPPLLPGTPADRAFVRSVALAGGVRDSSARQPARAEVSEAHAEGRRRSERRVVPALGRESGFDVAGKAAGGDSRVGTLCFGDTPTLADLCLVPQVFNARRFNIDMSRYPTIERIADHAEQIDAFARAAPAQQPDAE